MINMDWFPDWEIKEETSEYIIYKNIDSMIEQKVYKYIKKEDIEKSRNRRIKKYGLLSFNLNCVLSDDDKHIIITQDDIKQSTLYFDKLLEINSQV